MNAGLTSSTMCCAKICCVACGVWHTGAASANATIELEVPTSASADRVVLQEDQTEGQLITGYVVEALQASGTWEQVAKGESIGNKAIQLFQNPNGVNTTKYRLRVTDAFEGLIDQAIVKSFSVYACDRAANNTGCSYKKDTVATFDKAMVINTAPASSPSKCCSLCTSKSNCAAFVVSPTAVCTTLSATGVVNPNTGWVLGT